MIVERIVAGLAVVEGDDGTFEVPASWLPSAASEGSALRIEVRRDGETSRVVLALDPEWQAARESEIRRLRDSIPEGPGGDVTL